MDLIDLFRTLWRWWWLIFLIVLVTTGVLWFRLSRAEPVYEAQVKLQVSAPQRENVAAYDEYGYISLRDEMTVARNNFTAVLESGEVYSRTVGQLALAESDAEYGLDVSSDRDADFLHISVESGDPELAANVANTHVDAAISYYGELRAKPTSAEKELFAEQLRVADEGYRKAQANFAEFKAQNDVTALENDIATQQALLEQLQMERDRRALEDPLRAVDPIGDVDDLIAQRQKDLERLTELKPDHDALEEAVRLAREKYQLLLNAENEAGPAPDAAQAALRIGVAEQELHAAEEALADFQSENGIVSMAGELATHQRLLEQLQLERDRRVLEEPTNSVALIRGIDKLIAQRQDELSRLVAVTPEHDQLQETARQAYEKYQHVAEKYVEAELKVNAVQAANFIQVVERASVPTEPVSGAKMLLLLAVTGSLGIGVLLAFLLDYVTGVVDDSLRVDGADTQAVLGLTVLGTVPRMAGGRCEPASPEASAIRQLRTQIQLSSPRDTVHTLLVTSPQRADGKTVVTANLGVAMAGGGAKVVLVDADLRAPALHEWLDQPNLAGLADLLQADPTLLKQLLPQVLRETLIPGLSLLSAGHLPQDASLLLSSPNMAVLLELLSNEFEVVVFDSPPLQFVPDAVLLARLTEETLLVLSPDRTSRKAAQQAVDALTARENVRIVGAALNRMDLGPYRYSAPLDARTGRLGRALSTLPVVGRPADPNLISMSRAARELGVRADTIERWCQDGRLPAEKRGLTWWVRRDELQNMSLDRLLAGLPSDERLPALSDGRSAPASLLHVTARATSNSSDGGLPATPSIRPAGTEKPVPVVETPEEDAEAASHSATASA